jgi:hypothetical protein
MLKTAMCNKTSAVLTIQYAVLLCKHESGSYAKWLSVYDCDVQQNWDLPFKDPGTFSPRKEATFKSETKTLAMQQNFVSSSNVLSKKGNHVQK